uniref:VWFA domain-containing protein n=1 Tax=Panagrolaimus sp. ES5 TaxID=591445 RepID=A0AC34GRV7_9BILA
MGYIPTMGHTQLTFIETILGQMTHPERIRYGEYNEIRGIFEYPWDPSNTQNGLQQAINTTNQTTSGGSILRAIRMLVSDENLNQTAPDSTLIFVANTANSINIQQAVNLYNSALKYIGIKLTFILVGSNTNAADLQGFDDAIIYNWQNIGFFSEPDGWDLSDAFRCIAAPYIPCQSWIYFGIDDSNALNSSDYVVSGS